MYSGAESYERFLKGDRNGMQELVEMYRDGLSLKKELEKEGFCYEEL